MRTSPHKPFAFPRKPLALFAAMAMALAACGSDASDSKTASSSSGASSSAEPVPESCRPATGEAAYPLKIKHAYGETVIQKKPERVATVAWANHEVPLALGVVPVGMSKATWGDDDGDGVLPWVKEKLDKLGAATPALFDETDGIPFEQVENSKPDVILASYSGLSKEDYQKLSKIAPVVAYPDKAWTTSMDCMIRMNSKAIGMAQQGEKLVADLKAQVTKSLNAHPGIKGKKILFSGYGKDLDLSKISFYTTGDPRAGFLKGIGLPVPKIVEEKSKTAKDFFVEMSSEQVDKFDDVDVVITYGTEDGNSSSVLSKMQKDSLVGLMPAVKKGHVAVLGNSTPLASSANPSPLSIPWGIDKYFALLEKAAK